MQIRRRIKTAKPDEKNDFEKSLEQELLSFSLELAQILNKGLKFSDNFNAETLTIADSGLANAENALNHTLKRIPSGYLILKRSKGGVIYDGTSSWTDTQIFIKCATANTAITLLVF